MTATTNVGSERETRQALIVELLSEYSQPLTSEEIAYALGDTKSDVRKDLRLLRETDRVAFREETQEERVLRYGGIAKAQRANLYSVQSPVPARTDREVVDGFVKSPAEVENHMSTHEVARRLARFFDRRSTATRFTSAKVASQTGISVQTVRGRLRTLNQKGFFSLAGFDSGSQAYRMKDKDALLDYLGHQAELKLENGTKEKETEVRVTKTPPAPQEGFDVIGRAGEILDENERLREQNTQLKNTIDELRKKLTEAEEQLEELTKPKLDQATMQRLAGWKPSA